MSIDESASEHVDQHRGAVAGVAGMAVVVVLALLSRGLLIGNEGVRLNQISTFSIVGDLLLALIVLVTTSHVLIRRGLVDARSLAMLLWAVLAAVAYALSAQHAFMEYLVTRHRHGPHLTIEHPSTVVSVTVFGIATTALGGWAVSLGRAIAELGSRRMELTALILGAVVAALGIAVTLGCASQL